jgi:DNA repair exonuclease SbcCD ATPase subunit
MSVVDELLISLIGLTISIIGMLGGGLFWLGGEFKEIRMRFKEIDERFKQIDERFKEIDKRFEEIDERFDELRGYVDKRFNELRGYVDGRFNELKGYVDGRFNELKGYIDSRVNRLSEAFSSYQEFFIELLMTEGVIKPERAFIAKNEARRIMRLATSTNPLTKEEWKRLGELLDKDDLTLEEALELRELARKVVKEYGEYPEAWKLHIYASIMVGRALRKMSEGGK